MTKFLQLCGVVFAAIGLALGVLGVSTPGQLAIHGLTTETAAILLVGGVLAIGLGSLLAALSNVANSTTAARPLPTAPEASFPARMEPPAVDSSVFKRRTQDVVGSIGKVGAVAAGTGIVAEAVANDTKSVSQTTVAETIEALEQAKTDIKAALGETAALEPEPLPEDLSPLPVKLETVPVPEPAPELDESTDEPEPESPTDDATGLYVVEEQVVRGKAARILSDGTVEAETDEGWMRFENMEHLNEYLDSVG